jgi:hypothetical protein
MTNRTKPNSRLRLLRDVLVFQIKLGLEALLDITLIPVSLAAAGLDFVLGNWRRPRWFHAVLRFGERCERRIDLWAVPTPGAEIPRSDADVLMRGIEILARNPGVAPDKLREFRRWAATKIAPGGDNEDPKPKPKVEQPD